MNVTRGENNVATTKETKSLGRNHREKNAICRRLANRVVKTASAACRLRKIWYSSCLEGLLYSSRSKFDVKVWGLTSEMAGCQTNICICPKATMQIKLCIHTWTSDGSSGLCHFATCSPRPFSFIFFNLRPWICVLMEKKHLCMTIWSSHLLLLLEPVFPRHHLREVFTKGQAILHLECKYLLLKMISKVSSELLQRSCLSHIRWPSNGPDTSRWSSIMLLTRKEHGNETIHVTYRSWTDVGIHYTVFEYFLFFIHFTNLGAQGGRWTRSVIPHRVYRPHASRKLRPPQLSFSCSESRVMQSNAAKCG